MEIGSEFWNATVCPAPTGLFPASAQWYLSGRMALNAILRDLPAARTAALPAWCCHTMVKPFLDAGLEIRFYPVRKTADGLALDIDESCDILLVMDYFGFVPLHPLITNHPCVVCDITHSLFSSIPPGAKYYFGSLRKWCGVFGGGYAWSDHPLPRESSPDAGFAACKAHAMASKAQYLKESVLGQPHSAPKNAYLESFARAETILDELSGIPPAHPSDVFIATHLDADVMVLRRRSNARILLDAFPELRLIPELRPSDVPLCVPILVPGGQRDALRNCLIEREIYLPIHWPRTPLHADAPDPDGFYRDELSLVCDQRYTETDMDRLIGSIRDFLKG